MVKKISFLTVSIALIGSLIAPAAQAAEAASVELRRDAGITWADASVQAGSVRVVFLTPKNQNGRRQVWQSCRFSGESAGTYQCGIDTADGSLAAKRDGRWLVKVKIDSTLAAKKSFSI